MQGTTLTKRKGPLVLLPQRGALGLQHATRCRCAARRTWRHSTVEEARLGGHALLGNVFVTSQAVWMRKGIWVCVRNASPGSRDGL